MKTIRLNVIICSLVGLFAFASCGDDGGDPPANSDNNKDTTPTVVIDSTNGFILGDDQYFVANINSTNSYASFNDGENNTSVYVTGTDQAGDPVTINITFPGQSKGTWNFSEGNTITALSIKKFSAEQLYASDISDPDGKLIVTKYGAVGETIEGTFSGLFKQSISSILVSNGTFKIVRK